MSLKESALILHRLAKIEASIKVFARLSFQRPQYSQFVDALSEALQGRAELISKDTDLDPDLKKTLLNLLHSDPDFDRANS